MFPHIISANGNRRNFWRVKFPISGLVMDDRDKKQKGDKAEQHKKRSAVQDDDFSDRRMTRSMGRKLQKQQQHEEGKEQNKQLPIAGAPSRIPGVIYPVSSYTREEKEIYNKKVLESNGFDCGYVVPGFTLPGLLFPIGLGKNHSPQRLKFFDDMAKLALTVFNDQNGTSYKFVKVIRINARVVDSITYDYITFEAKNDMAGSPPQKFQALVCTSFNGKQVKFCRFENESKPPEGSVETPPFVTIPVI